MPDPCALSWPLTVRACNVLATAGIRTVDDMRRLDLDELADLMNCGALTLAEIYCQAVEHHIRLEDPKRSRAKRYLRIAARQGRFPLFVSRQPAGIPFSPRALIIVLARLGLFGPIPSLRELARERNVTPERIRQLEQRGLRWLRSVDPGHA